jgi:hypothetical protein
VVDFLGKLSLMLIKSFAMLEFSPGSGFSFLWGWIQWDRIIGKLFLEDQGQGLNLTSNSTLRSTASRFCSWQLANMCASVATC